MTSARPGGGAPQAAGIKPRRCDKPRLDPPRRHLRFAEAQPPPSAESVFQRAAGQLDEQEGEESLLQRIKGGLEWDQEEKLRGEYEGLEQGANVELCKQAWTWIQSKASAKAWQIELVGWMVEQVPWQPLAAPKERGPEKGGNESSAGQRNKEGGNERSAGQQNSFANQASEYEVGRGPQQGMSGRVWQRSKKWCRNGSDCSHFGCKFRH